MLELWGELIGGILTVMLGSYLFTEGAEGIGSRFSLSASFLGAVVSPIFTSMPEAVVLLVSILQGARDVGVGTVFGEPFMASTLSYSIVAASVLLGRRGELEVDRGLLIPYALVTVAYPTTLLASVGLHWLGAVILLAAYAASVLLMRRRGSSLEEYSGGGRFIPKLAASLLLMPLGSHLLVEGVKSTASTFGVGELTLSLVLVPLATALPETMSAAIWAFKGKGTLAMGALVGEKAVFSTVYPAVLLLTVGYGDAAAVEWSVASTVFSSLVLMPLVARRRVPAPALFIGLVPYAAYLAFMIR